MGLRPGFLNAWWSQFWQMKRYSRGCSGEVFLCGDCTLRLLWPQKGKSQVEGITNGKCYIIFIGLKDDVKKVNCQGKTKSR